MPADDWDDSWYDDDDFPPPRAKRGRGGVVSVAVITFIMCGFNALCMTCLLFCGMISANARPGNNGNFLPGDLIQHTPMIMLGIGLASAVAFVAQIIVGVGLINNRRWSRTVSFYLAGYSTLMAFFLIYLIAAAFGGDGFGDEAIAFTFLWIMGLIFHGGYAATVFFVLLNSRVAASLR